MNAASECKQNGNAVAFSAREGVLANSSGTPPASNGSAGARTRNVTVRFSEAEYEAIQCAAENAGGTQTTWVRDVILRELRFGELALERRAGAVMPWFFFQVMQSSLKDELTEERLDDMWQQVCAEVKGG